MSPAVSSILKWLHRVLIFQSDFNHQATSLLSQTEANERHCSESTTREIQGLRRYLQYSIGSGPTFAKLSSVCLQNNANFSNNLQLIGGFVPLHNASMESAPVEQGEMVEYSWMVQENNGPANDDMSSIAYVYGSNVDYTAHVNAGLYGAVVIAREVSP